VNIIEARLNSKLDELQRYAPIVIELSSPAKTNNAAMNVSRDITRIFSCLEVYAYVFRTAMIDAGAAAM